MGYLDMEAIATVPPPVQRAIAEGHTLTRNQLETLIAVEAKLLGLSVDDALACARAGTLPRSYVADDLALLIGLLATD